MKKSIAVKALSAGICFAVCASMSSCYTAKPIKETGDDETKVTEAKKTEYSETEPEITVTEITEETTTASSEETTVTESLIPVPENHLYDDFITGYQEAIKAKNSTWYYGPDVDTSDYMNLGQGLIVVEIQNGFHYTFYDFDKDGVEELVIGGEYYHDGESDPHIGIKGIVTIDEDGYKIVAAGWSRSSLEYVGGGYFVHSGSGGAALHYDAVYKYDGNEKELATVGMLVTEFVDNDAVVTPNYSYFADEDDAFSAFPAYGDERAVCFDDEAEERFNKDLAVAYSQTNEMKGREWVGVDCT